MENLLYVEKTIVNDTQKHVVYESDIYETFTDNITRLYQDLRRQYGAPRKMYSDHLSDAQVGWVFHKTERYSDSKNTYKQSAKLYSTSKRSGHDIGQSIPPIC